MSGHVNLSVFRAALVLAAATAAVAGCGGQDEPAGQGTQASQTATAEQFSSGECNEVSDDEIGTIAGQGLFTKVVDTDTGCFWQENTLIGSVGEGMGISTWWYRGSDLDTERMLETDAGRQLTELTVSGNKGFEAADDNACSVYVTKGADVITWSIQTLNPSMLPDLCGITEKLAQLSQDRVN